MFKLVILDEADTMDHTAQMALRRIIEDYAAFTRFCIITNNIHKLLPALISRSPQQKIFKSDQRR